MSEHNLSGFGEIVVTNDVVIVHAHAIDALDPDARTRLDALQGLRVRSLVAIAANDHARLIACGLIEGGDYAIATPEHGLTGDCATLASLKLHEGDTRQHFVVPMVENPTSHLANQQVRRDQIVLTCHAHRIAQEYAAAAEDTGRHNAKRTAISWNERADDLARQLHRQRQEFDQANLSQFKRELDAGLSPEMANWWDTRY